MPTANRSTQQDRNRKMAAAVAKYLATLPTIFVTGIAYTPAQIITMLQANIGAADAATVAKARFHDAVVAAKAQRATLSAFLTGFRTFVLNQFKDEAIVAEFGFSRKQVKRTVDTKATAVTKAKATRTARHTLGPKQKKSVKGTVTPTAPSAPSTASQPSATAPSQGSTSTGTAPRIP